MKTKHLRIIIIVFFVLEALMIADVIQVASNKVSWGWLGYNVLAWLVLEVINLVFKKARFVSAVVKKINFAPLFAWFLVAIFLNTINAIFFYQQTFGRFDRFAHFVLLGVLGSLVCLNLLGQFLRLKQIKLNIYLQAALVFMFMNTLSVLHEIAEYVMERFSIMAITDFTGLAEIYDTADDIFLLALGSFLILLVVVIFKFFQSRKQKQNLAP